MPHVQLAVHVAICVPHIPHACIRVAPGWHAPSPMHVPHVQLAVHVCVPQLPHICVSPGVHAPQSSVASGRGVVSSPVIGTSVGGVTTSTVDASGKAGRIVEGFTAIGTHAAMSPQV